MLHNSTVLLFMCFREINARMLLFSSDLDGGAQFHGRKREKQKRG
jgi:hypothetical protein